MNTTENRPVSIGDWILTLILVAIPLVNIVMLIVWAASGSTHPSKKSYAQASLILFGIILGVAILAAFVIPIISAATRRANLSVSAAALGIRTAHPSGACLMVATALEKGSSRMNCRNGRKPCTDSSMSMWG